MAGQRFPRAARLSGKAAFDAVFAAHLRVHTDCFRLHALPTAGRARLGLAVTRKVAPRAVERNRLRRLAREMFRRHQPELEGFDIVLVARPAARDAPAARLRDDLERAFARLPALNRDRRAGRMAP